jgi:hypothetical protein
MRLKDANGRPIITELGTAIWAEDPDGEIRGGGLVTYCEFDGPNWSLECTDLTGTSIDLPYTDANYWIDIDPAELFRYIWWWIQSQPGGNVGIEVDNFATPVRLGNVMVQRVDFDLEADPSLDPAVAVPVPIPTQPNPFTINSDWVDKGVRVMKAVGWTGSVVRYALESWLIGIRIGERDMRIVNKVIEKIGPPPDPPYPIGRPNTYVGEPPPPPPPPGETGTPAEEVVWEYEAYKLAWYKDHNLAQTIDDLASMTPFDWYLTHEWVDLEEGESRIRHRLRVGYPKIGRRLDDLRFVVGENVRVLPKIERDGTEYANEVLFLGAGEGSAQVVARAFRGGRDTVRKVAVVSDPSVTDQRTAMMGAERQIAKRVILDDIAEIVLEDHPNAPMGSVSLGDEFFLEGETGWIDLGCYVRVVERHLSPESGEAMTLTVIRTDRLI